MTDSLPFACPGMTLSSRMATARLWILAWCAVFSGSVVGQVPQIINYQGRISVAGNAFTGTGQFRFALVNGNGTTSYWSNDGTSNAGSEPTASVALPVVSGLYVVPLGDTSIANMATISPSVFNNPDVRVRVWFNDGLHGSQLLAPDQRITSVGYAMISGSVSDGAITTAKIAAGAVGSTQLAAGAVNSTHLSAGAVGSQQIANGAITAQHLAAGAIDFSQLPDGSISPDKLAKPVRTGSLASRSNRPY